MSPRATLETLTVGMTSWRWRIEVDDAGGWWLTHDGKRRNRKPWYPVDEMDALVAVTLLFMQNEAGDVPLPDVLAAELRRQKRSEAGLRLALQKEAYSLLVNHLMR